MNLIVFGHGGCGLYHYAAAIAFAALQAPFIINRLWEKYE